MIESVSIETKETGKLTIIKLIVHESETNQTSWQCNCTS